jgi:CRP/FNR family transcriptional regulator, cyclic AMP receptor protein
MSLLSPLKGQDFTKAVLDRHNRRHRDPFLGETAMQFRKLWFLQRFNVFQDFPREKLVTAARMMDEHMLKKRDRLYQPGDPADQVYFVKQGHLKLYRRGRFGQKITLAILSPGEVFGDLAFSAGEVHEQEVEALETSLICSITAKDFQALLDLNPALAFSVIQNLGEQRRRLERKIASLVFKDVPARLAEALLELADCCGQPCAHHWARELVITQQDLADLIGATRQVVNATLKQFRRRGLIDARRHRVCLADPDGLRGVAEFTGQPR